MLRNQRARLHRLLKAGGFDAKVVLKRMVASDSYTLSLMESVIRRLK
jgi:hypothetical protein